MTELPFKTINASVRPGRVAILVDKSDDDWQNTCLRIVENYSGMWGGGYNIIVPSDGNEIGSAFWTLLEVFDPDYVYRYQKTGKDLLLSTPDQYKTLLEQYFAKNPAGMGVSGSEDIREYINKSLQRAPLPTSFAITPRLNQEIKIRLAPFWFEECVVQAGAINADCDVAFPLTSLADILPTAKHPDRVLSVEDSLGQLPTL